MNPCEDCEKKLIDDYGMVCALGCGKGNAHANYEAGADAILDALRGRGEHFDRCCNSAEVHMGGGTWVLIPDEVV